MVTRILAAVAAFVIAVISATGYWGVFFLMAIESACIPLPSEIIMPFAGHLVERGELTLGGPGARARGGAGLWGAGGRVPGGLVAYAIGYLGGRPLVERYGRYVMVSR